MVDKMEVLERAESASRTGSPSLASGSTAAAHATNSERAVTKRTVTFKAMTFLPPCLTCLCARRQSTSRPTTRLGLIKGMNLIFNLMYTAPKMESSLSCIHVTTCIFALQVTTLALFFHTISDGGQRLHVPAMQLPANSLEEQALSRISANASTAVSVSDGIAVPGFWEISLKPLKLALSRAQATFR